MKKILCVITLMILVACAYGLDLGKSQFSLSKELAKMGYVSLVDINVPATVKEELPTSFDLRDVEGESYVKDARSQDIESFKYVGWAFAAATAAESSYMMKNDGKSPYFSVTNIINRNPLSEFYPMEELNKRSLLSITGYFQNLTGPIYDKDDPYEEPYESPEEQPKAVGFVDNITYISDDTVRGFDSEEIAAIKTAVMTKGAVYMTHYMNTDCLSSDYKYCYCSAENPYPYHGVAIIGWDDNVDKTKFATEPAENGAFLVVNSASHWLIGNEYVWISYCDTSLSEAVSFDFTSKDSSFYNDRISYNKLPLDPASDVSVNARYARISYTAKTSGDITGIRPWFKYAGLNNTFTIYVNGEKKDTRTIESKWLGYQSEDLEKTIYYNKGDDITVYCEYNITQATGYNDVLPLETNIKVSTTDVAEIDLIEGTNFYSQDNQIYYDLKDENANIAFSLLVQRRDVDISFDKEELEMHPRDEETITATVTGTEEKEIVWKSSDEDVVTVDAEGLVTAIAEGEAVISATTVDGKVTATCDVTVTNVIAEELKLDQTTLNIDTGYSEILTAIITPENTTFNTVTWSSSDENIAVVDENGEVTGLKEGTCTIMAAIPDGLTAECEVTVKDVDVTAVILEQSEATIDTSSSVQLIATVYPERATYKTIKWESSDPSIAKVSSNGLVKGVYPGEVVIKASTSNGKYAECVVTVKNIPVKSISLNKKTLTMETRSTAKLVVSFNPSNASYKDITWTSSNTKVATVNDKGVVTSKSIKGKTTITAKSRNGKKATCVVNVELVPVEDVKISKTKIDLNLTNNKTYKLTATVLPKNATNQAVTWKSTDTKVAKVNTTGIVTAVGAGSCLVVVTTKDGGFVKTCRVNVKGISVTSVVLNESIIATKVGKSTKLTATISPKNATNKKVTWSSSNAKVVKVDKNGIVKAVGAGKATIKCVSQDTGVSDSCIFNVKK